MLQVVSELKVAALVPLGFVKKKEIERSEMKCVYVKEGITSLIQVEQRVSRDKYYYLSFLKQYLLHLWKMHCLQSK